MDLDCTQQGILFSDERKNIQQPVFALGVLDTLPCFGIRHMQVVGVKLLSAGQKHSSPLRVPVEGAGSPEELWTAPAPQERRSSTPGEAPTSTIRLLASQAAASLLGPRCARLGGPRGAGARVGPADSKPSRILY